MFLLLSIPMYSVEDNKEIVSQFDTTFEYRTNQWESLLKLMEDCTPSDSSIVHNPTECASRLSAIPNIFPMTYNKVIANYIDRYALKGKKYTARISESQLEQFHTRFGRCWAGGRFNLYV